MKKLLSASALALALSVSATNAGEIALGGRFNPGFSSGYVDAIIDNFAHKDTSGVAYGDTFTFSTPPLAPQAEIVTINTPNYGLVTGDFTQLASFNVTPDGEFWTLYGTIDGSFGFLSVNLVTAFGIPSFGFYGQGVALSPPVITPPPCEDCGITSPPVVSIPETSTWLMLLTGFALLSIPAFSKRRPMKTPISTGL